MKELTIYRVSSGFGNIPDTLCYGFQCSTDDLNYTEAKYSIPDDFEIVDDDVHGRLVFDGGGNLLNPFLDSDDDEIVALVCANTVYFIEKIKG